jgi:hypothetical protein
MPIVAEIQGNLFDSNLSLAHCVSEDLRMGAGIAVQFKKIFKRVDELVEQKKQVGEVAYIMDENRYIFYIITKKCYYQKPTYESLEKALRALDQLCSDLKVDIAVPQLGCGLDKLEWCVVRNMLDEMACNVTVYVLNT